MITTVLYIIAAYLLLMTGMGVLSLSRSMDEMRYVVQHKNVFSHPETWREKEFRRWLRQSQKKKKLIPILKTQTILAHFWQCYVHPWRIFDVMFGSGELILPLAQEAMELKMIQKLDFSDIEEES